MTNPTHYYRPQTLAEAIERAAQPGCIALVGGALTLGGVLLPYETVIDLQDLRELKQLTFSEHGLHLGGSAMLQRVVDYPHVPDWLKRSLTRALPLNIRNGASVAESLTAQKPPCEWLAALAVMNAVVEHAGRLFSGDESDFWEQPIDEFVNLLSRHGHPYQGVIIQVRIPDPPEHTFWGTAFISRTPADSPIVNAAAQVTLAGDGTIAEADVAICGASAARIMKIPVSRITGQLFDMVDLTEAAAFVEANVEPVSDALGSSEYRAKMAGVCVRRALEQCRAQVS